MAGGVPVGQRGVPAVCEEPCQQPLVRPVEEVEARALQQVVKKMVHRLRELGYWITQQGFQWSRF